MGDVLGTPKLGKSYFECDVCGDRFKIANTINKHFNTKNEDLNCKVCHQVIKTSMKVLKHVARTSLPTYPLMKGKLK